MCVWGGDDWREEGGKPRAEGWGSGSMAEEAGPQEGDLLLSVAGVCVCVGGATGQEGIER